MSEIEILVEVFRVGHMVIDLIIVRFLLLIDREAALNENLGPEVEYK